MPYFISLFFDAAILTALGVTIFYCFRLSKQLKQLRANRTEFETLIRGLDASALRASAALRSLREDAVGSGDLLQDKINKSRAICEELEIMIQAGDGAATRLQALTGNGRQEQSGAAETSLRTRAERELMEAVRAKQKA